MSSSEDCKDFFKNCKFTAIILGEIATSAYQYVTLFSSGLVEESITRAEQVVVNVSGQIVNTSRVVTNTDLYLQSFSQDAIVLNLLYYTPVIAALALLTAAGQFATDRDSPLAIMNSTSTGMLLIIMYIFAVIPGITLAIYPGDAAEGLTIGLSLTFVGYTVFLCTQAFRAVNDFGVDQVEEQLGLKLKANSIVYFQTFDLAKDAVLLAVFTSGSTDALVYVVTGVDIVLSVFILVETYLDAEWDEPDLCEYVMTVLQFTVYSCFLLSLAALIVQLIGLWVMILSLTGNISPTAGMRLLYGYQSYHTG